MGKIPAKTNMISAVFTNPQNNQNIAANTDFTISVQTQGLAAGTFTNAANTYYSAPQDLNSAGLIIGHTHVTVQDLGKSQNPTTPLDPTQFAFFKGINDAGNNKGLLSATVTGGLPAGNYRVCSMTSAANHQPVLMPVAQRGAQDDCVRFTVGGNAGGGSGSTTTAKAAATTTTAKAAATTTSSSSSGKSALAGIAAPAITSSGDASRPFEVNGNTFTDQASALQRACDIQQNACSNAANSGTAGVTVSACQAQQTACNAG
jgi:transcription initiation factor TFIID subunit 15